MSWKFTFATVLIASTSVAANADTMRGKDGSMNFDMGYGIQVNEGSTLQREWVIVNDNRLPVSLTSFETDTRVDERNWIYDIDYDVEVGEAIQAIEIRFIPFDIWGESNRTLSATDIKDISPGESSFSSQWRILSENDAVQHYAMLGYVAQVKLASGQILRADVDAVVEEARRFSDDFSSADLSTED